VSAEIDRIIKTANRDARNISATEIRQLCNEIERLRKLTQPRGVQVEDVSFPKALDNPECREALKRWLAYKTKRRKPHRDVDYVNRLLLDFQYESQAFCRAVEFSMKQEYQGLFRDKSTGSSERQLSELDKALGLVRGTS
jgi:hypothetical protein